MSLSIKAIDRIFARLTATYGADFLARYRGVPEQDLKTAWAHELAGFECHLNAIGWALENLPERAPNVIEFRNLARHAPLPEVPRLPEPKANPARVAEELAKLATTKTQVFEPVDHKAWATRILTRHQAGEKINPTSLLFARQAMGIES